MKHYRIYLAISALILASLACQSVMGGRDELPTAPSNDSTQPDAVQPTAASDDDSSTDTVTTSTDFPITSDAFNLTEIGDGSIVYYTKLSMDDALKFYREEYTARGYTERDILTVVDSTSGTFSIVFDGDPRRSVSPAVG